MELGMHQRPHTNRRIIVSVSKTQYSVVKKIVKGHFRWTVLEDDSNDNWDIMWQDGSLAPQKLLRIRCNQKINHFAGMFQVAKKNYLCANLNILQKEFPSEYDFYPATWALPQDYSEFKSQYQKGQTYIAKPQSGCQGRGIYLFQDIQDLPPNEKIVIQKYLKSPYLLDGLKFDFRIYVLITSCNPLRLFIYEEGLARFATQPYQVPTEKNLIESYMHLTNYSLNKYNPQFQYNKDEEIDDEGHKRSLTAVFQILEEQGVNIDILWGDIQQTIIKTMCAVQPHLHAVYKSCNTTEQTTDKCFQILGFDIMLDTDVKPWLLEVNHASSFATDTPLDLKIKSELIKDTLAIVNDFHVTRAAQRPSTGQHRRSQEQIKQDRVKLQKYMMNSREAHEQQNMGGFTKIYPCEEDYTYYDPFLAHASAGYLENQKKQVKRNEQKSPIVKRTQRVFHTDQSAPTVFPLMDTQITTLEQIKAYQVQTQKRSLLDSPDLVRKITFQKLNMTPAPSDSKLSYTAKSRLSASSTRAKRTTNTTTTPTPVPPPKLAHKGGFLRPTNMKLNVLSRITPRFRPGMPHPYVKPHAVSEPRRPLSRAKIGVSSKIE